MELSEAIPLIISRGDQIEFLIVGDGPLRTSMEEIIEKNKCMDMVTFAGWVPYESIPDFLNKMRFHILPSHTEAIGSSNIEAIACGVIPIINNVGALPGYVVIDKSTGFVLENNLPETIVNKFDQIWMYSETDLEAIQKRGINLMLDNYTYDRVSEKWQKVLKETFEMRRG
jgi:glycosyltransferase involved in cell wall biosynthesis